MQRVGEILGLAVKGLERPEGAMAWLSATWPVIVGKELAAHTKPVRCVAGVLEISAAAKDWLGQIEGMAGEFRNQINRAWGGALVREVHFSLAHRPRLSKELDGEHTPFVRTGAKRSAKPNGR